MEDNSTSKRLSDWLSIAKRPESWLLEILIVYIIWVLGKATVEESAMIDALDYAWTSLLNFVSSPFVLLIALLAAPILFKRGVDRVAAERRGAIERASAEQIKGIQAATVERAQGYEPIIAYIRAFHALRKNQSAQIACQKCRTQMVMYVAHIRGSIGRGPGLDQTVQAIQQTVAEIRVLASMPERPLHLRSPNHPSSLNAMGESIPSPLNSQEHDENVRDIERELSEIEAHLANSNDSILHSLEALDANYVT